MAASRDNIRIIPQPEWTADDIFHVGTVIDARGRITVAFKRGSLVKHVHVQASSVTDAVMMANLK